MNKTGKRKGKRKMWTVIFIIIAVLGAGALAALLADSPGRSEIAALTFADVPFTNLQDGTYIGEFKGTKSHSRDTKVEVKVSDGEISDVRILKGALDNTGKPSKLTGGLGIDDLFNNAVKSQTLKVDVISGATITSKAHLKAFENALEQAQGK